MAIRPAGRAEPAGRVAAARPVPVAVGRVELVVLAGVSAWAAGSVLALTGGSVSGSAEVGLVSAAGLVSESAGMGLALVAASESAAARTELGSATAPCDRR